MISENASDSDNPQSTKPATSNCCATSAARCGASAPAVLAATSGATIGSSQTAVSFSSA